MDIDERHEILKTWPCASTSASSTDAVAIANTQCVTAQQSYDHPRTMSQQRVATRVVLRSPGAARDLKLGDSRRCRRSRQPPLQRLASRACGLNNDSPTPP